MKILNCVTVADGQRDKWQFITVGIENKKKNHTIHSRRRNGADKKQVDCN
jgi:hypothetical protein